MTYTVGGGVQAVDYNGFVSTTSGANVNNVWGSGSTDSGWGQTPLSTVSSGGTVTATQWADLVNTLASLGSQTGTTITSRTAPVAGDTVAILSALNTDLTSCTTNRGNAVASGTTSSTWTGNIAYTSGTISSSSGWTQTWTQTITFANANSARYFWNAGGLVRLDMSKTSTGSDKDADWNTLVGQVGTIYVSGRVNSAAQTIAGVSYTGTTRVGGSGGTQTTLATTTGWYSLTPGGAATTIFQLNDASSPYTGDYIRVTAAVNSGSTVLTLVTTWVDAGYSGAGKSNNISGGTNTTSPYTTFGTASAVLCRFVPPSTTYLSNSWGTPTVASTLPLSAQLLAVAGGGGSTPQNDYGGGGGGGGGVQTGTIYLTAGQVYTVAVGSGAPYTQNPAATGGNSSVSGTGVSVTALGGGSGGTGGGQYSASGGSGGGGSADGATTTGAAGTAGQGNSGGNGANGSGAGGGGGAGAAGGNFTLNGPAGSGGTGIISTIITSAQATTYSIGQVIGSDVYFSGGGGGGGWGGASNPAAGSGGNGGGGAGSAGAGTPSNATNGTANTGGGGGGVGRGTSSNASHGGNGGSGVVIISVPTANYTGTTTGSPTVVTNGSNTVMIFTGAGSYTA